MLFSFIFAHNVSPFILAFHDTDDIVVTTSAATTFTTSATTASTTSANQSFTIIIAFCGFFSFALIAGAIFCIIKKCYKKFFSSSRSCSTALATLPLPSTILTPSLSPMPSVVESRSFATLDTDSFTTAVYASIPPSLLPPSSVAPSSIAPSSIAPSSIAPPSVAPPSSPPPSVFYDVIDEIVTP